MKRQWLLLLFIAFLLIGCAQNSAEADNPANSAGRPSTESKLGRSTFSNNCVHGSDYWQGNPAVWTAGNLTIGGVNYNREQLQAVLNTPAQDDATYLLAHQLIAAKLNISNNSDETAVAETIAAADAWLVAHPLGSNPGGTDREASLALMQVLGEYNNGLLGPAFCSDTNARPTVVSGEVVAVPPAVAADNSAVVQDDDGDEDENEVDDADDNDEGDGDLDGDGDDDLRPGICDSTETHPHAATLAERYNVTYQEIMGWFCAGYGFGEIEHAYMLSQQSGLTVSQVFDLRASGLGWGQIRKQLDGSFAKGNGNSDDDDDGPGNGNGNGNNGNGNGNGNGNNGNGNGNGGGNGNGNNGNGNGNGGNNNDD